jgi:hypothetical protein
VVGKQNREQTTNNKQQTTNNRKQTTNNRKQTTNNKQQQIHEEMRKGKGGKKREAVSVIYTVMVYSSTLSPLAPALPPPLYKLNTVCSFNAFTSNRTTSSPVWRRANELLLSPLLNTFGGNSSLPLPYAPNSLTKKSSNL